MGIHSQNSMCSSTGVQTVVVCREYTTMGGVTVLYGDKGYMFHKGSNVAKKMDAWVQKELRDSQYRSCTVARTKKTTCSTFT